MYNFFFSASSSANLRVLLIIGILSVFFLTFYLYRNSQHTMDFTSQTNTETNSMNNYGNKTVAIGKHLMAVNKTQVTNSSSNKKSHLEQTIEKFTMRNFIPSTTLLTNLYFNKNGIKNSTTLTGGQDPKFTTTTTNTTVSKSDINNLSQLSTRNLININFKGRLGNLLFQFASLYGISKHQHLTPVVDETFQLRKIFNISTVSLRSLGNTKIYKEKRGCVFEKEAVNIEAKFNWTLDGYFQSWKYFSDYNNEIKAELTFRPHIQKEAVKQFSQILEAKNVSQSSNTTYVAVHVRRGDIVSSSDLKKFGYASADVNYFHKAMAYFQSNYSNVVFIVSSEDMAWCKSNLNKQNVAFIIHKNPPEIDMAILSNCNHSIISSGSYGWWTAWFVGGKTIYYKDSPKPGSKLAKLFNLDDYILPHWIPM